MWEKEKEEAKNKISPVKMYNKQLLSSMKGYFGE